MTQARRDARISAALRHVRDAERLLDVAPRSLDQAYHLAGFGPECARKACLTEGWADIAIGHNFDDAAENVLTIALDLDPRAHRYRPDEWATRYPVLADWQVTSRYWRTGTADEAATRALVENARTAVDDMVFAMWSDGLLTWEAIATDGDV